MHLKLISCNVFLREACWCIAQSPHVIDLEFTELGEHASSDRLRALLQSKIDATEAAGKPYDAILLLFGMCGNATVGLEARRTKLVIPRAHDCCTILLGSKEQFIEHFQDAPSTPFSSSGYIERGSYFLRTDGDGDPKVLIGDGYKALGDQYGEEDAKYIWEQMHPNHDNNRAVFIELPQTAHLGHARRFEEKAAKAGKETRHLPGDIRLIKKLIFGEWDEREFLIVNPGEKIRGVYDWHEIVRADKA
jgi:hypothetical protein